MCDFPVKKEKVSGRVELTLSYSWKYWPKRFVPQFLLSKFYNWKMTPCFCLPEVWMIQSVLLNSNAALTTKLFWHHLFSNAYAYLVKQNFLKKKNMKTPLFLWDPANFSFLNLIFLRYLYLSKLVTLPGASGAFLRLLVDQVTPIFL